MVWAVLVFLAATVVTGLIVYGGDQQAGPLAGMFSKDTGENRGPRCKDLGTLSFALAGAIYEAACVALATTAALIGVPGFRPFVDLLTQFYGFYGYSVSALGVVVGAVWGFVEGFVHFGIFAWLYNLVLGRRRG